MSSSRQPEVARDVAVLDEPADVAGAPRVEEHVPLPDARLLGEQPGLDERLADRVGQRPLVPGEAAGEVGEALIKAGLLAEKPSVGQRHVFLDPRHVKEIRGLIERGELPHTLDLPAK